MNVCRTILYAFVMLLFICCWCIDKIEHPNNTFNKLCFQTWDNCNGHIEIGVTWHRYPGFKEFNGLSSSRVSAVVLFQSFTEGIKWGGYRGIDAKMPLSKLGLVSSNLKNLNVQVNMASMCAVLVSSPKKPCTCHKKCRRAGVSYEDGKKEERKSCWYVQNSERVRQIGWRQDIQALKGINMCGDRVGI